MPRKANTRKKSEWKKPDNLERIARNRRREMRELDRAPNERAKLKKVSFEINFYHGSRTSKESKIEFSEDWRVDLFAKKSIMIFYASVKIS